MIAQNLRREKLCPLYRFAKQFSSEKNSWFPTWPFFLCYGSEASGWGYGIATSGSVVPMLQYGRQGSRSFYVTVLDVQRSGFLPEPVVWVCLCYGTGVSFWGVPVLRYWS